MQKILTSDIDRERLPALVLLPILGLILFCTASIVTGAASVFRPGYVIMSCAIAILLYARYPKFYIAFVWWIWFITPLISRLIDWRSSFDPSRLILISQYLVTLITLHSCLKNLPRSYRRGGLPFLLAFVAIFYGYLVGLIKTSPITATRGLFDWLTPISFSFYLFINWRDYPKYRQSIQQTFLSGVLVTGIYGIYQFLVAPEWDRYWLISTKIVSFGNPEPFQIRVWSTMASPGPFAAMMMAGLLLLFNSKEFLRVPAAAIGYLAFLLSLIRTMWGCWLVAIITLLGSLKPKIQMRLFITILIMALCVIPLTTIEPFSGVINTRLQTFTNLEQDNSADVRQEIYKNGLNQALTNIQGNGIGNTFIVNDKGVLEPIIIDSGILDLFFTLGWFGSIPYLAAMQMLLFKIFQYPESRFDSFMAAARAIGFGCILAIPISSMMLGFSGMILWSFLGIVMAAHSHYQHQNNCFNP